MASETPKMAHYDTIVLGAGTAGLACASRLFKHPKYQEPNSLLVLEGRDRIGGRVGAVEVNGTRLDTGANWIHGIGTHDEPNPLVGLVPDKRYRELSSSVAFQAPPYTDSPPVSPGGEARDEGWVAVKKPSPIPSSLGDLVIPSDVAGTLMGSLWGSIGTLGGLASTMPAEEAKQTTILRGFHTTGVLEDAFNALPEQYHRTVSAIPQFIENMEAGPLAAQSAEHAQDHPGMGLLEYAIDDFDGAQVFLRDGYLSVLDNLAEDVVEAGLVKLESTIRRVSWKATGGMTIESSAGTFTADRIVCTLPLGVLKQDTAPDTSSPQDSTLFQPALPDDKMEAIESLGFGTLDKIFMVYSKPWWNEEPFSSIFQKGKTNRPTSSEKLAGDDSSDSLDTMMGFTEELPGIEVIRDGTFQPGIRMISVLNLHGLTGFPALSTFVSCANAMQVEALSDAEASAIVHRSLTSWLGREPPKPEGVHVTRWAQDEFSQGSYSHMIAGLSETRHREAFQTPVAGSEGVELRFAGEHTSRNHFATVHGALISGWREADAILSTAI